MRASKKLGSIEPRFSKHVAYEPNFEPRLDPALIKRSNQSHKSKVGTIMNYQFYMHFEIKISYLKSGMGNMLYS